MFRTRCEESHPPEQCRVPLTPPRRRDSKISVISLVLLPVLLGKLGEGPDTPTLETRCVFMSSTRHGTDGSDDQQSEQRRCCVFMNDLSWYTPGMGVPRMSGEGVHCPVLKCPVSLGSLIQISPTVPNLGKGSPLRPPHGPSSRLTS